MRRGSEAPARETERVYHFVWCGVVVMLLIRGSGDGLSGAKRLYAN